jgi:hypothetical protein
MAHGVRKWCRESEACWLSLEGPLADMNYGKSHRMDAVQRGAPRNATHDAMVVIAQAFINTAKEIYKKIQDGVFDVSNEVSV